MKPRNFPANKLIRQWNAKGAWPMDHESQLEAARNIRTKKDRSSRGKRRA